MKEKEFENLKVGDKVWCVTNIWGKENKPYELKVTGKRKDYNSIETISIDGSKIKNISWLDCQTTKVKALEAVIERCEARIKDKEDDIAYEKKELDRYKSELAKEKEEEKAVVWIVDFDEGKVVSCTKRMWEESVENYEWSIGSLRYKKCETEQEANEVLAEYYKKKYEETLKKACSVKYFVCGKRIVTLHNCYCAGNFYGYDYDGLKYCSVHKERDIFNNRQEAEAELERRKKNG